MYIYIKSMSEHQSEIYRNLTSVSRQINLHIIKILLYPNCEYVDHWMHEIWSFLFDVDKQRNTKKWPKESFLKKSLSTHNDLIEQYVDIVIDEESFLEPRELDYNEIKRCIEDYYSWVAEELSKNGRIRQSETKTKLKEILDSTL